MRTSIKMFAAALIAVATSGAAAPIQRTFVASYGGDANPCNLTSPCRSFNAALSQTATGGEVIVLDSAGYGPMTITQSASIIAPAGVYAGISVFSGDGITINGAGAKVVLRNLTLTGLGGANGITIAQAADVLINDCRIASFTGYGVKALTATRLSVHNTTVRGIQSGVVVAGDASTVNVDLDRIVLWSNNDALGVGASANVSLTRSLLAASAGTGAVVNDSFGNVSRFTVRNTLISDNAGNGIATTPVFASVSTLLSVVDTTITRNAIGVKIGPCAFCEDIVSATRNLITQQSGDALFVQGSTPNGPPKNVIVANDNTFSRSGGAALHSAPDGFMRTVKGTDGLPNNAGEEATPTSGPLTVVNPFSHRSAS